MYMYRDAVFDSSREYRYSLTRAWESGKDKIVFILLNPSVADESEDDPTAKRCIGYAQSWGYKKLEIVNLFGLISPDPNLLKNKIDPVGKDNDRYILKAIETSKLTVLGWGAEYGCIRNRDKEVLNILKREALFCLGKNANGSPKHPLYLAKNLTAQRYL